MPWYFVATIGSWFFGTNGCYRVDKSWTFIDRCFYAGIKRNERRKTGAGQQLNRSQAKFCWLFFVNTLSGLRANPSVNNWWEGEPSRWGCIIEISLKRFVEQMDTSHYLKKLPYKDSMNYKESAKGWYSRAMYTRGSMAWLCSFYHELKKYQEKKACGGWNSWSGCSEKPE